MTKPQIEQKVIEIITDVVMSDSVQPGQNLRNDLGIDSLEKVEIELAIEQEFNLDIEGDESNEINTVEDIINLVNVKLNG